MGPMVILVTVLTAVLTAAAGSAWGQWLEHRRRAAAMEVIKAAMVADKEPPREVLDEIGRSAPRDAPWSAVIAFSALACGFWIAYARLSQQDAATAATAGTAFLVVAATMTVTALGLLALALTAPRGGAAKRGDDVG